MQSSNVQIQATTDNPADSVMSQELVVTQPLVLPPHPRLFATADDIKRLAVFAPVRTAPFLPLHAPSSRIWALPLLPGIVRCPPSVFRDHPGPRFQIIRPDGEYPSHFCPVRQTSLSAEIIMMHFPSNNAQVQSNIFPPFSQCRNRKKHKRFKKNTHSICSGYPGGNFGERQAGRKAAEKDCAEVKS